MDELRDISPFGNSGDNVQVKLLRTELDDQEKSLKAAVAGQVKDTQAHLTYLTPELPAEMVSSKTSSHDLSNGNSQKEVVLVGRFLF